MVFWSWAIFRHFIFLRTQDSSSVRQWLLIGQVDNIVIELWLFTCTVAGSMSWKNVGTLCSTWNVDMRISTLEWVCRSFSLVIPIGKSNTPLLQMYSCFFGFEKVPVCVLVSSKSCGPPCGGSPHGVLLRSRLGCWVLVASSGEIVLGSSAPELV